MIFFHLFVVVVKLMEAGEFEYASKSIQILSISGGTISQNGDTDAGTATKVYEIMKEASKNEYMLQIMLDKRGGGGNLF